MREKFLVRGYFKKVVNDQKYDVAFDKNQSGKKILESIIPFVATYNPKI